MNKQEPTPTQLLQEIYKYFCDSMTREFRLTPKNIVHIQACFESLMKHLNNKPKIDGYEAKKAIEEGKKWMKE